MRKQSSPIPIAVSRALARLGADVSAARRRRRLPMSVVADRALTTRQTLGRVERGDPGVAIGTWATILFTLGMEERVADIAAPEHDSVGLALEAEQLPRRIDLRGRIRGAPKRRPGSDK